MLGVCDELSIDPLHGTKATVDVVLSWVIANLRLGVTQRRRAKAYLAQPALLNVRGLHDYMRQVLVERAAKKHRKTLSIADLTRLALLDSAIQTYRDASTAVRSLGGRRAPSRPLYYRIRNELRTL